MEEDLGRAEKVHCPADTGDALGAHHTAVVHHIVRTVLAAGEVQHWKGHWVLLTGLHS